MDLTIVRSKWLHNEPFQDSRLYRPSDGKMCCLGFYGIACGHTIEELNDRSDPNAVDDWKGKDFSSFKETYATLMNINDERKYEDNMPQDEQEERIKTVFKSFDVNVTFVD